MPEEKKPLIESMFELYYSASNIGNNVPNGMKDELKKRVRATYFQGVVGLLYSIRKIQKESCCPIHEFENMELFLDEIVDELKASGINNLDSLNLYGPLRKQSMGSDFTSAMMELLKELMPIPPSEERKTEAPIPPKTEVVVVNTKAITIH